MKFPDFSDMFPGLPEHKYYALDADNNVVVLKNLFEWALWFEHNVNHRIVGMTQITSEVYVSTVFLGVDHSWDDNGPPVLFETMIFGGPEEIDREMWRYTSWDDAEVGHKMAVKKARKAMGQNITTPVR